MSPKCVSISTRSEKPTRVLFPDATKAELVSKFQDYLDTMDDDMAQVSTDKAVRQMAEQHVRWQARPKQAYNLIVQ